jgi:16S rRNA (cytidine1402-2'-O)-methyltransferase
MSLMASGFNGQGFAFNGYLPIDDKARDRKIRDLESLSAKTGMTQIFIETPYRNNRMLERLCNILHPDTRICVACDITDRDNESIITLSVRQWKGRKYDYHKRPAIFLIHK